MNSEGLYYFEYETPVGMITLSCINQDIVGLEFGCKEKDGRHEECDCLIDTIAQLNEYFLGKRKQFDFSYRFLTGTPFQQKVWKALLHIPYGQTATYKDIAQMVGSPKACRAVGGANHNNPIAILIPCHRIIGANQSLVGYGGGLDKKIYLLNLEKEGLRK